MKKTKPANGERDGRKRRRRRRKDKKHCNNILILPDDIIVEIFCKIPIKTLIQCKCVCKSWRHSLSDPEFTKSLFSRAPICLILEDRRPRYPVRSNKHILVDMESVSIPNNMVLKLSDPNALYNRLHTNIIGSCNGFLCLVRYNYKTMTDIFNISNPITGESIPLPVYETMACPVRTMACPVHFGFGFSSVSDVYKVVLFITYQYRNESKRRKIWKGLEVMVLTVGSGIWRRIEKVHVKVDTKYGVFHDGFLHWICESKRSGSLFIRAFDVEIERFKDIPMPPYSFPNSDATRPYIGVLKGSLSVTFRSSHTFSVWVMKEHGIAKSWTKELEIGGIIDSNCQLVRRGRYRWSILRYLQVLKFFDEGEVLLFDCSNLHLYTSSTRTMLRVEDDVTPLEYVHVVAAVHVPSFVSPKDIIRNYISKHPEEKVGASSTIGINDIKMPAWTTSVAGWGENDESELLEIPRGQPTPCLPLPEDLKYVSSTTATSLLDMISGLNALLLLKCLAGKDEIQKLRKENDHLRARVRLPLEGKMPLKELSCTKVS